MLFMGGWVSPPFFSVTARIVRLMRRRNLLFLIPTEFLLVYFIGAAPETSSVVVGPVCGEASCALAPNNA